MIKYVLVSLLLIKVLPSVSAIQRVSLSSSTSDTCAFTMTEIKAVKKNITEAIDDSFSYKYVAECGTGLWKQVINLNMSNSSHQCPHSWTQASNPRSCSQPSRTAGTCTQVTLSVHVAYSKVCGRILGRGKGTNDAFQNFSAVRNDINYVDGVTIFRSSQHIWTFAAEQPFDGLPRCPCSGATTPYPHAYSFPPFVGTNYFCDVHRDNGSLWNGSSCIKQTACCNFNSPPWFTTNLPVAGFGDLQVSICSDENMDNEDVHIEQLVLHIQ